MSKLNMDMNPIAVILSCGCYLLHKFKDPEDFKVLDLLFAGN